MRERWVTFEPWKHRLWGQKQRPWELKSAEMRYDAPRLTILADRGDLWRYGYLHRTIHESGASKTEPDIEPKLTHI